MLCGQLCILYRGGGRELADMEKHAVLKIHDAGSGFHRKFVYLVDVIDVTQLAGVSESLVQLNGQ